MPVRFRPQSEHERAGANGERFTLVISSPLSLQPHILRPPIEMFLAYIKENNFADDVRVIHGDRFVAFDGASNKKDEEILGFMERFIGERLQSAEFHPDGWPPLVVRDPKEVQAKLRAVAGDKYSYRQMDEFTELIEKTEDDSQVSKVNRSGLLNENVFLLYSQERLAAYNIKPGTLEDAMRGRNISTSGGQVNVEGKNVTLGPGGEFKKRR